MNRDQLRKSICSFLLILCALLTSSLAPVSRVFAEETKTVRVGYIDYAGFIEMQSDLTYRGYGVDYLNEIAKKTGWKYDYVYDTWDNCMKKLENGEIDLLCTMQYTAERDEIYDFSSTSIGSETNILYVSPDREDVYYNDYVAMNGMRVALLSGSYQTVSFQDYARKNGFSYTPVYFDNENLMLDALNKGKVDMLASGSLAKHQGLKTVGKFGSSPFYMTVKEGNRELLDPINTELDTIKALDPHFEANLYEKYYGKGTDLEPPLFTREEMTYIENAEPINIGIIPNYYPLSKYDENTTETSGILIDLGNRIAEKSGLSFNYIPLNEGERPVDALKNGVVSLASGVVRSEEVLEDKEIQVTSGLFDSNAAMVCCSGCDFSLSDSLTVATTSSYQFMSYYLKNNYPNYTIKKYDTVEACLKAVQKGEADAMIHDTYIIRYYLENPHYEDLTVVPSFMVEESYALIASKEVDATLMSILNKTIAVIDKTETNEIVSEYTVASPYKETVGDFLYKYRLLLSVVCLLVLLCGVLVFVIGRRRMSMVMAQKEAELYRDKAERDALTGLYNRGAFYEKVQKLLEENANEIYNMICMNIERFKVINDLYGVKEGDHLLQALAAEISQCAKVMGGVCGRLASDNFVCCIPRSMWEKGECRAKMRHWLEEYPLDVQLFLRYGVYVIEDSSTPVSSMCDWANLAADSIRGNYANNIAVYNETHRQKLLKEQNIINEMEGALSRGEFDIYLQPKVDLASGKLVGSEALVRWFHPEKGMIPPCEFIPIFERNGFILKLDFFVWKRTCELLKKWQTAGLPTLPISVNVSRMNIYNYRLCEELASLVDSYDLSPELLELEITESAYTDDPDRLGGTLKTLQENGFKILMDDFGSGYSSLNMLKEIPVNILKLDLRFLADVGESRANMLRGKCILQAIIQMAQGLNLPSIAEGVETQEQVDFLKTVGCEWAQGYYFSRPIPIDAFEVLLKKG